VLAFSVLRLDKRWECNGGGGGRKGKEVSLSSPSFRAWVGSVQLLEVKVKGGAGKREREATGKGERLLRPYHRGGR
jgi:hypothetical protein